MQKILLLVLILKFTNALMVGMDGAGVSKAKLKARASGLACGATMAIGNLVGDVVPDAADVGRAELTLNAVQRPRHA